ncbi:hypothetical protein MMC17_010265 [Xylographa soralifera]|nr:hypothetical protein [Xylographa soralifera]
MAKDNTRGNGVPDQEQEIQKSRFDAGNSKPMSKAEFKNGDEANLAVFEGGRYLTKRMEIVAVARKGLGSTSFVYQVKPKVDGEKAEVYKDEKGNDWFDEEDLVMVQSAPRPSRKAP